MALKQYKPNTAGQRGLVLTDNSDLHKGKPFKKLTKGLTKSGGRNNFGHLTARRQGGGHKRKYRLVDFKRNVKDVFATVERIEYDPNRTANIALIKYENDIFSYIISPQKLKIGDKIISSDKAVRPTSIMGASKRLSELIVQAFSQKHQNNLLNDGSLRLMFSMVRFGNVLDSSGSVVPLFKEQIANGGPITLTHEKVIRYFMTIPEAAQLVIQASVLTECGDVFLLDMG